MPGSIINNSAIKLFPKLDANAPARAKNEGAAKKFEVPGHFGVKSYVYNDLDCPTLCPAAAARGTRRKFEKCVGHGTVDNFTINRAFTAFSLSQTRILVVRGWEFFLPRSIFSHQMPFRHSNGTANG